MPRKRASHHRYFDFTQDRSHYYIVLEVVAGGELFDRIVSRVYYSEKEARDLVWVLLDVLHHLHGKRIAHRDLKPENLLLKSTHNDHDIKLADFGFATEAKKPMRELCGTPAYVAPEIIKEKPHGRPRPLTRGVRSTAAAEPSSGSRRRRGRRVAAAARPAGRGAGCCRRVIAAAARPGGGRGAAVAEGWSPRRRVRRGAAADGVAAAATRVVRHRYGLEVDMWSCGVIVFILLGGYPPFDDGDGVAAMYEQIKAGSFAFDDRSLAGVDIPWRRVVAASPRRATRTFRGDAKAILEQRAGTGATCPARRSSSSSRCSRSTRRSGRPPPPR